MKTFPPPLRANVTFGLPYVEEAGSDSIHEKHFLDLYVPEGPGFFPTVVWIHGGGWAQGDRNISFASDFLKAGLAVASISYRLTSRETPFPAQIEDCLTAVAWLKKYGRNYHLDINRMGVAGHSAGGHLAGLVATTGEIGFFTKEKVKMQAGVFLAPALDLGRERGQWPLGYFAWKPEDQFCRLFFPNGVYEEDFAQWASPYSYLHSGMPPMLVLHGDQDDIVPMGQAKEFCRAAQTYGVEATFQPEPGANHDVSSYMVREMIGFFQKVLGQ